MYGEPGQDSGYEEDRGKLHAACRSGSLKEIQACLADPEIEITEYHDGEAALHVTVSSGREDVLDVINILLDKGADINAQTTVDNNTALHLAVLYGNFPMDFDIVLLFLQRKPDLSLRNKSLRTPYDCAMATSQYELAATLDGTIKPATAKEFYIRKLGERYGPFIIQAVLDSNERQLREYVQMGGNPNHLNKHGAGAIHYAVTHCNLPVYETLLILLHAGVDVNLRDEEGDPALNLVIKTPKLRQDGQMVRCVELLTDSGASSNLEDLDGKDAVALAEERNYEDVLALLGGSGKRKQETPTPEPEPEPEPEIEPEEPEEEDTPREDVNAPNSEGLYPIHLATMMENSGQRHARISNLLERGAQVSSQMTTNGNTALHICAERDYGETARILLNKHIDYTIRNKQGKTAYELALDYGNQSVANVIKAKQDEVRENWQRAGKKAKFCTIL